MGIKGIKWRGEGEAALDRKSSLRGFQTRLGNITPSHDHTPSLACQIILVPTWGLSGTLHRRVRATIVQLASNEVDTVVLEGGPAP